MIAYTADRLIPPDIKRMIRAMRRPTNRSVERTPLLTSPVIDARRTTKTSFFTRKVAPKTNQASPYVNSLILKITKRQRLMNRMMLLLLSVEVLILCVIFFRFTVSRRYNPQV